MNNRKYPRYALFAMMLLGIAQQTAPMEPVKPVGNRPPSLQNLKDALGIQKKIGPLQNQLLSMLKRREPTRGPYKKRDRSQLDLLLDPLLDPLRTAIYCQKDAHDLQKKSEENRPLNPKNTIDLLKRSKSAQKTTMLSTKQEILRQEKDSMPLPRVPIRMKGLVYIPIPDGVLVLEPKDYISRQCKDIKNKSLPHLVRLDLVDPEVKKAYDKGHETPLGKKKKRPGKKKKRPKKPILDLKDDQTIYSQIIYKQNKSHDLLTQNKPNRSLMRVPPKTTPGAGLREVFGRDQIFAHYSSLEDMQQKTIPTTTKYPKPKTPLGKFKKFGKKCGKLSVFVLAAHLFLNWVEKKYSNHEANKKQARREKREKRYAVMKDAVRKADYTLERSKKEPTKITTVVTNEPPGSFTGIYSENLSEPNSIHCYYDDEGKSYLGRHYSDDGFFDVDLDGKEDCVYPYGYTMPTCWHSSERSAEGKKLAQGLQRFCQDLPRS